MMLDDELHEEGYLVHEGFIYHHGRVLLPRASKGKEMMLQRAYKEFCFSPTYSMNIYNTIMGCFEWEGFGGELHQHFQECMNYVELGQPYDSMQELFQPSLPSLERGERSMHNSMCMRDIVGEGSDHVKKVSISDFSYSFTMFMQAMTPRRSDVSCKSHGKHWATKISEFGHSLVVQREIFFHDGCFPRHQTYLTLSTMAR